MSEIRHYSQERVQLANAYPGKKWAKKVSEMSDAQVHAAWISVRKRREKCDKSACKSEKCDKSES